MSTSSLLPTTPHAWHARVWRLAFPIIISNMSVPLVGAVDTAVVGHLSDPVYIGAVATGSVLFSFLFWGFGFLRMGTTGFVAQAYGADDMTEVRTTLLRALLLGLIFGLALVALQSPIRWLGFVWLSSDAGLLSLAADYFHVRIWSGPATLVNHALLGCLIGTHRSGAALGLQLLLNGSNIALNFWFVLGLGWGVEGVALASVLAEYLAAGAGLWSMLRWLRRRDPGGGLNHLLEPERIRALAMVNVNIFLRTLFAILTNYAFLAAGTRFGEVVLAANAILMHLQHFLAHGLDGFAHAAEALAGSAFGSGRRAPFRAAVRVTTVWALVTALVFTGIYAGLGKIFIGWMTGIPEVRETAVAFLPWLLISPILSVWSFQLDGIFIGATQPVEMRNSMLLSLVCFLGAAWLLMPWLGNHGLWLAYMVFMVVRALTLGAWYPRLERALRE